MANPSNVIFYRYDGSPFSDKVNGVLLLKNIPHTKVDVSRILPRPELSELLGVSYRRIPILAIGNDIYCDTSLIASALERRFPSTKGYGTIFPAGKNGRGTVDSGIQKAYATFYCDRPFFRIVSSCLPWSEIPQNFVDDRGAMMGTRLDTKAMTARIPAVHSELASHLDIIEEQLSDSREWLFDTVSPGLADVSLHCMMCFVQPFSGIKDILNAQNFPKTLAWIDRVTAFLAKKAREGSAATQKISGERAAELIGSSDHESLGIVGFNESEASRLNLKAGLTVRVAPDDYGQTHPTQGMLVGLSREEVVLETSGSTNSTVRVHFPRLGYVISGISQTKL